MGLDTKELKTNCLKVAATKHIYFIEDVLAGVGIARQTFYTHFPKDSQDYKDIVSLLTQNKIKTKQKLRTKWLELDNPTLQVALMKLLGNKRDRKRLTQSHIDATSKGQKIDEVKVTVVPGRE